MRFDEDESTDLQQLVDFIGDDPGHVEMFENRAGEDEVEAHPRRNRC